MQVNKNDAQQALRGERGNQRHAAQGRRWAFYMSLIRRFCLVMVIAVTASCAGSRVVDLPVRGRVFIERQNSRVEPAPNVLVLAQRINVCDRGFISEGSTTGIDAYLIRSDSNGVFEIPPITFQRVCSRAILLSTAFLPNYKSQSGRVLLHYDPNKAKAGFTENDAFLIPSIVDENRARELSSDLYFAFSSYTVNGGMAKEIYLEMLPEIEMLAKQTSRWHADCYRIGSVAEEIDKRTNQITCKHYQYKSGALK